MSHKFEKRCEARQKEIRDGSVLAHVTKRIAAITPPRALVVLRFLLNTTEETDRIWPNPTTPCYLTNYSRSTETGEIFGLDGLRLSVLPGITARVGCSLASDQGGLYDLSGASAFPTVSFGRNPQPALIQSLSRL